MTDFTDFGFQCFYIHWLTSVFIFQDAIKERDLKIRKIEQENESLNFRNQQLTKKVEGLQEQLRTAESRGSKNAVSKVHPWTAKFLVPNYEKLMWI